MQLTTFTFNILYMIYFIGTVVTAHSLNKTPRKKVDCIITWMLICLIMILCSFIFTSIDKELFPSIDMKNDLFLLTNLIPLLAYKHLFPNNSITYNIFSYFTNYCRKASSFSCGDIRQFFKLLSIIYIIR